MAAKRHKPEEIVSKLGQVPPFYWGKGLGAIETIALAVHFQDMDMVGEAVQQSPGQTFRAEYLRPLIERQVGGHQDRAPLVALAEDFEQQLGAGLGSMPFARLA